MIQLIKSPFARSSSPLKDYVLPLSPVFYYRLRETSGTVIYDESINNVNATLSSNPKDNPCSYKGSNMKAAYNQFVSIPTAGKLNNLPSTGFTLSFWFNSLDISSTGIRYCLFSLAQGLQVSFPNNCIDVIKNNDNTISCRFSNSVWGDVGTVSSNSLSDNTWYHFTVIYNPVGNIIRLYMDGVMTSQTSFVNPLSSVDRIFCYVAKSTDSTINNSTCSFKELMIFNTSLTEINITNIYNLSAPTQKLSGVAKDSTFPFFPASVVLVRSLPDGETVKIIPDSSSAYWETFVSEDFVYDITAYGPEGSMYKPEIIGPIEP